MKCIVYVFNFRKYLVPQHRWQLVFREKRNGKQPKPVLFFEVVMTFTFIYLSYLDLCSFMMLGVHCINSYICHVY